MKSTNYSAQRFQGIAFLGNYLPRACGIATFTYDLANAVAGVSGDDQPVIVAAMNDLPEGYAYPERVKFELRQDYQVDYSRAADFLNFSQVDVVSLQHEYGIFGGEEGSNVLTTLRDLKRPVVATCHTVLEKPTKMQREVLSQIASHCEKLVVMSERAFGFLETAYDIPRKKIVHIPHGIHDTPFIDPSYYKDKFAVEGRKVLLTFGLLTPNKGVEQMIEALPKIVERHPKTSYVVLGATHPAVIREQGESYRLSLQRRVRELGLEEHVLFHPRFVELDELLEYLGATDIFVTPYLYLEQITSGALAYAMGAGKAVVSTPYWHAEELLADGRGVLVPPENSAALSKAINDLLDDEVALSSMRKRAYTYCRQMVWSSVARSYLDLFNQVRSQAPVSFPIATAMSSPIAPTNLPMPKLDHLRRLTDDTGPCRHTRHTIPDWSHGYSLEHGASVLVAATKYHSLYKDKDALKIAETCVSLIQTLTASSDNDKVYEGLDYQRHPKGEADEGAIGKAVWALGYLLWKGPSHLSGVAYDLFHQILPSEPFESLRGASYAALGACNYLCSFPGASEVRRFLQQQMNTVKPYAEKGEWLDAWPQPDWPTLVQACCIARPHMEKGGQQCSSQDIVAALREKTKDGTFFPAHEGEVDGEENPTTAAGFIEAIGAAYEETKDQQLLTPIRSAVDWFLGANKLKAPLYDFSTGGCHDALTPTGVNRNQGTDASVYCLLSFLSLDRVITTDDSGVA